MPAPTDWQSELRAKPSAFAQDDESPAASGAAGPRAQAGGPYGDGYAIWRAGPAWRISSEAFSRYFSKLSANMPASCSALAS